MKEPTEKKFKELQHYVAVFKKTKKGQSVLSTICQAAKVGFQQKKNSRKQVSTSWKFSLIPIGSETKKAGGMFLDGNYFFFYSRTQKSIALSSSATLNSVLRRSESIYRQQCMPWNLCLARSWKNQALSSQTAVASASNSSWKTHSTPCSHTAKSSRHWHQATHSKEDSTSTLHPELQE